MATHNWEEECIDISYEIKFVQDGEIQTFGRAEHNSITNSYDV